MLLDLAAVAVLALFTGLGYWRGALDGGTRLGCLVLGYGAAVLASRSSGPALASALGTAPILAGALAGMAAFLACYLLATLATWGLRRRDRRRAREQGRSGADRGLGALLGGLRGAVLVLLLGWLGLFVQALQRSSAAPGLPDPGPSAVTRLSGHLVERAAESVVGSSPSGRVAIRLVARPDRSLEGLQQLLSNPALAALQQDATFWTQVEIGAVDAALARSSFRRLESDPALREALGGLGLADVAADDPEAFRETMRAVLEELGPRLQALREDPELQKLMADPELQRLLDSGRTGALLAHPGFRSLVRRIATS